ncbi:uncharacterized protein LOC142941916 [Anarhichas minor]|uniref:uncharacterized protein LOC142941916 n=1 Tax=Anarhichas minor TaxID=65739 RepID=UPI003F73AB23
MGGEVTQLEDSSAETETKGGGAAAAAAAAAAATAAAATAASAVVIIAFVSAAIPLSVVYKVLLCWTDWFDRDNPSGTGDWETLRSLRRANPGKICLTPVDIEAQTLTGFSVAAAGDVIHRSDTTTGFICRNGDQRGRRHCNDYRVRFSCRSPYCGGKVCWTNWYDRDNPSGTGDWERLVYLRRQYPGQICDNPLHIEAVTTDTNTPATLTGDVIYISNPTQGFACRKRDQRTRRCRDYKVRFGCPC